MGFADDDTVLDIGDTDGAADNPIEGVDEVSNSGATTQPICVWNSSAAVQSSITKQSCTVYYRTVLRQWCLEYAQVGSKGICSLNCVGEAALWVAEDTWFILQTTLCGV